MQALQKEEMPPFSSIVAELSLLQDSELSGIALCRPSFCVSLVFGVARVAWLPGNGLVIVKECANKLAGRFF